MKIVDHNWFHKRLLGQCFHKDPHRLQFIRIEETIICVKIQKVINFIFVILLLKLFALKNNENKNIVLAFFDCNFVIFSI